MAEENKSDEYYINLVNGNIGSRQDCTGMIPTAPLSEAEREGYTDIYPVPQQVATSARTPKDKKRRREGKG